MTLAGTSNSFLAFVISLRLTAKHLLHSALWGSARWTPARASVSGWFPCLEPSTKICLATILTGSNTNLNLLRISTILSTIPFCSSVVPLQNEISKSAKNSHYSLAPRELIFQNLHLTEFFCIPSGPLWFHDMNTYELSKLLLYKFLP